MSQVPVRASTPPKHQLFDPSFEGLLTVLCGEEGKCDHCSELASTVVV